MPKEMMAGKIFINSKIILPIVVLLLYVVAQIVGNGRMDWLLLPSSWGEWLLQPWSLISYGLVHTNWLHFVVNMVLLTWLALSPYVGVKEYWGVFALGVMLGGIVFVIGGDGVLIGSSSGIAAIVPIEAFRRWGKKWGAVVLALWIFIFEFVTRGDIGGLVQSIHMTGYLAGIIYLLTHGERVIVEKTGSEDLVEKVHLSGYSSLSRREREEIRQMGI